jgi:hypothetical protein
LFRWADEAEHEWSGAGGEAGPALDLAAPCHWRLRRAETRCGAFQGLRVLLYGDFQTPSTEALKRIVLAGGGQVTAFRGQPEKLPRSVLQSSGIFVSLCLMATPGSLYWGARASRAGRGRPGGSQFGDGLFFSFTNSQGSLRTDPASCLRPTFRTSQSISLILGKYLRWCFLLSDEEIVDPQLCGIPRSVLAKAGQARSIPPSITRAASLVERVSGYDPRPCYQT